MTHGSNGLTLVLASQRSGSTLLCRDIESLGGMGAPGEHFLELLRAFKEGTARPGEAEVLEAIGRGVKAEAPDIGAVKLMVNYAPRIDAFIRGGEEVAQPKAMQNIIDWAQARFERLNLVVLIRANALDQAISRVVARQTQVWHRKAGVLGDADPHGDAGLDLKKLNQPVLKALPGVIRNTEILRKVARANRDIALTVEYEDLAASAEDSARALVAHARRAGFEPRRDEVRRKLSKLIDADKSQAIRAEFRSFLQAHLGLW